MSTLRAQLPANAAYTDAPVFRLSLEKYQSMTKAGLLTENDPVELIEGVLTFQMPKDELHNAVCDALADVMRPFAPPESRAYRQQASITLSDGEPEPDGAIADGGRHYFARLGRKPFGNEVLWVAEVADSSLRLDRTEKFRSYARAGISVYWIVNLLKRQIEVYTDPDPTAAEPAYRSPAIYDESAKVPVVLAGQTVGEIAVADILP